MNIILDGILKPDTAGHIGVTFKYPENGETFIINIGPDTTFIKLPYGDSFSATLDNQQEFYELVKEGDVEYRWGINGYDMRVEIDMIDQKKMFRLELEGNDYWWAGLETEKTRYLKKYPIIVESS